MKKVIISFILGVAITFVGVKAAETLIPSSSVTYTKDGSSTNVNTALNTLFTDVNTIKTTGTATASDITKGKTAYVKGSLVTGTSTAATTLSTINAGGTATAADIASGKTAYVQGSLVTGTATIGVRSQTKTFSRNQTYSNKSWTLTFEGLSAVYGIVGSLPRKYSNEGYRFYPASISVSGNTATITFEEWGAINWGTFSLSATLTAYGL